MRRAGLSLPLIILLLTVIILHSLYAVQAETTAGVIVDGADSTWRASITASAGLNTNIQTINPSLVAQYAHATLKYKLLMLPSSLQVQLDGIVPSVAADFATAVAYQQLVAMPLTLQTALSTMLAAIETQFANSSYYTSLHYPLALMEDATAPTANKPSVLSTLAGTTLTWNTNEFARCTTSYGLQPGNYTQTIVNALYYQNHTLILQNLTPGAPYFGQFVCIDQSGNSSTSSEFTFTVLIEQRVWLPLIKK